MRKLGDALKSKPVSFETTSLFVALGALGLAGNYFAISLFFGVEFIFGSIASLILVALCGTSWGVASAALASLYTIVAWNHPYAFVILTLETFFVGLLAPRVRGSLVVASALYWILLGIPLVWLGYGVLMKLSQEATWVAALKLMTNGVFNALIANLVLSFTPAHRRSLIPSAQLTSLFQTLFNLSVAISLIPSLIIMTLNSRGIVAQVEDDIHVRLEAVAETLSLQIERWQETHMIAVKELANQASEIGLLRSEELQRITRSIAESRLDFINMYVADRTATAVAFFPTRNDEGGRTIGLNFADREYFRILQNTRQPYVSKVFRARGGTTEPTVTISAPIIIDQEFAGYALGAVNLAHIADLIRISGYEATIVDPEGLVISSTREGLQPLQMLDNEAQGFKVVATTNAFFRRYPVSSPNLMAQWSQTYLGSEVRLPRYTDWRLILEVPLASQQSYLYGQYLRSMGIALTLVLIVLGMAYYFASRVASPLIVLSTESTNLPRKVTEQISVDWPRSEIPEVSHLVENFKMMTIELQRRFVDLQSEIRERQRIEDELRTTNRLKDEFLATLSHELRTPMNVIMGYLGIIREDGIDDETLDHLGIVERNAAHLNILIQDLLDVSRIMTGKFVMEKEVVNLKEVCNEAVDSVRLAAQAKQIQLATSYDIEAPFVRGDAARLRQVFWNVLSNSVKFTNPAGRVEISLRRIDESGTPMLEVRVRDTGQGIAPEFLPLMFSRFRQEDGSMTRGHGGLGLGLAIVRQIIEAHGGTVRAESEGRGKGATITITLPASEASVHDP